jgi:hypothetical protein
MGNLIQYLNREVNDLEQGLITVLDVVFRTGTALGYVGTRQSLSFRLSCSNTESRVCRNVVVGQSVYNGTFHTPLGRGISLWLVGLVM